MKAIEKGKSAAEEFKAFILRGNIIDMAVGVIIGTAFGKIVASLVNDIFMPLIGIIIGGTDFSTLSATIRGTEITYGAFIQSTVDFIIIALCMFIFIKAVAKITARKKAEEEAQEPEEPAKSDDIVLLEEIRDLLKNR